MIPTHYAKFWLKIGEAVSLVVLVLSHVSLPVFSDGPPTTGCAMCWTSTARCSGSTPDLTSPMLSSPSGKLIN